MTRREKKQENIEMGKRIKAVRKALDLSQSDVAEVLGVTPITVSRWETGTQAPDDLTKRMIASVLKTTVAYLFGETSQSSSYESGLLPNVTEKAVELNVGKKTPNSIQPNPDDSSDALPTPATGSVVYTYKETIRVPIYEDAYAACAGNGNHNEGAEPAVMEYRLFDISEVGPISVDPDKQPFGIKMDGESMEEANIPDGSIAVDTVECGYTGGVGKAKTPDFSGVCKTFRHLPV